jgi:hypothetical protein
MLMALEKGVKGGTWYTLMDKVCSEANLSAAFRNVAKNKGRAGVDHRVVQAALRNVLDPIFERDFAEHSYGFRPGRGC